MTFIETVQEEKATIEKRLELINQIIAAYDPAAIAEVHQVAKKAVKTAAKEYTSAELREAVKNLRAEDPDINSSKVAKALGVSSYRVNTVW